eukprot:CAMPEP_0206495048 /NCGR_PEP_ID=MMETSP0324_2-20121206/48178_1 /ASSEMBLY_ACC=CAM_ASM_000836 /TAXON_ID=2866 /ORGANISM="Crypthecodinium cohnii, Strain Seligo" /LENGTH=54 /DNA_ID=CAMNT_0053978993 /DNA_START=193 /DNA_END=357 /DNA_ORIENTATION=-
MPQNALEGLICKAEDMGPQGMLVRAEALEVRSGEYRPCSVRKGLTASSTGPVKV